MFDDLPHNLQTAHALGMTTVLVACGTPTDHPEHRAIAGWEELPPHIHHKTDALADFLVRALRERTDQNPAVTESAA
jgi:putative hydrolase of the HAD superfamily